MTAKPRPVTVVVASFGKVATLRACLDAVLRNDHPDCDLIVADSGSTDGTRELLAAEYPQVRVLELPGASLPAALNLAVAQTAGRDIVRLHGDVMPEGRDWLRRLDTAAQALPRAGVIGCKLVHANGRIQSVGRSFLNALGPYHQNVDQRAFEHDKPETTAPREVDGVKGACCYIRRELLDVAAFDEAFAPAHGDDDDFCLQARRHGFQVFVAPAVTAVHYTPHRSPVTKMPATDPEGALAAGLDAPARVRRSHAAHFADKWGFDPRHPDVHEIRRRWGDTRICWQLGAPMRNPVTDALPAVDVAFVTCNSRSLLPRMLEALATTRWPADRLQVQVVDNGSTDGTVELLREAAATFPFPVHIRVLPTNVGVAAALNIAFLAGRAPLVARLDDDTIVGADWLERMVPWFARRPYCAMIGPKVLHDNGHPYVQSGPGREWPAEVAHGDRIDRGQFDCIARVVSVRGCCNLYRRDVFARVGLLDVRFAPSQYDEWDHHLALAAAGYDVLYDGTTTVRHALGAGRSQTWSGSSNAFCNQRKIYGKWGEDVWRVLDRGIDLSREGRFLSLEGNAVLPPTVPVAAATTTDAAAVLAARERLVHADGTLRNLLDSVLGLGERAMADGDRALSGGVVMMVMDVFPQFAPVLSLRARRAAIEGDIAFAERVLGWARALRQPGTPELPLQAPHGDPLPAIDAEIVLLPPFGSADADLPLLLELHVADWRRRGQRAQIQRRLAQPLGRPQQIHAFDLNQPLELLDQLRFARATAPDASIHLHPCWYDREAAAWGAHVLPQIYQTATDGDDLMLRMERAAQRRLSVDGSLDRRRRIDEPDWLPDYQRAVLALCDAVVVHHEAEAALLRERFAALPEVIVQPWPQVDDALLAPCRDLPRRHLLVPGPLHAEHAQLPAVHLFDDRHVVVHGPCPDIGYELLSRDLALPGVRLAPAPDLAGLVRDVALAHCVLLPTFRDRLHPAAAIARQLGVPVICQPGTTLAAGLGDLARPVDVCDLTGMATAAAAAFVLQPAPAGGRSRNEELVRS